MPVIERFARQIGFDVEYRSNRLRRAGGARHDESGRGDGSICRWPELDYLGKPFDFERLGALLRGIKEAREDRELLLSADARSPIGSTSTG